MGMFNNDFEPWPEEKLTGDRSIHWSDEDEELYLKELKRKKKKKLKRDYILIIGNMNTDKYIKSWNNTLILNPVWVNEHYMEFPNEMDKYQKIIDYYESFDIL